MMDDLTRYINARKKRSPEFAENYEEGYREFEYNVMLKQARLSAGITQDEMAKRLSTKKSAISRIENHASDIKLSTLKNFARALNKKLEVRLV